MINQCLRNKLQTSLYSIHLTTGCYTALFNSSPISNYWRLLECAMLSHASLPWTCSHCLKFLSSLCLLANSHFEYQVFCKTFSRECSKNSLCVLCHTIYYSVILETVSYLPLSPWRDQLLPPFCMNSTNTCWLHYEVSGLSRWKPFLIPSWLCSFLEVGSSVSVYPHYFLSSTTFFKKTHT